MRDHSIWKKSVIRILAVLVCCFISMGQVYAEDLDSLEKQPGEQLTDGGEEDEDNADPNENEVIASPAPKDEGQTEDKDLPDHSGNPEDSAPPVQNEIIQKQKTDVPAVTIDHVNTANGTFQAQARNIPNSGNIRKVEFAVWSDVNGQDDVRWYPANLDSNGIYAANININMHKYSLGSYQIHAYATDLAGNEFFVGGAKQNMDVQKGKLSVSGGKDVYTYAAELKEAIVPGGIEEIRFAVWSNVNGQDDVDWYHVKKADNGAYRTNISLKRHKGFGDYSVHVYAKTKSGELAFVNGKTFSTIDMPGTESVKAEKYDENKGTFQIVISNVKNSEFIEEIKVPVWSDAYGQDDLKWYIAKKNSKGQYIVDVNIRDHKYTMGKYIAHVYITDTTGYYYFNSGMDYNVNVNKGTMMAKQASNDKRQYMIELKDIVVPGGAAAVRFAVWSATGGQDDMRWYTADRKSAGNYQFKMSIENHKGLGEYKIHAYAVMPNGAENFINGTSFKTAVPRIKAAELTSANRGKGKFQIKLTGVTDSELIQKIEIPVWSEQNQGDLIWYTAAKNRDGSYTVDVDIRNHKYNAGLYQAHVYVTDATGVKQFSGKGVSCNMKPKYTSLTAADTNKNKTEKSYRITLKGLDVPAGENGVTFAVWGDAAGQNDLHWYHAARGADGTYTYTLNIWDHKELGRYNVHVYYTTKANTKVFAGATSFTIKNTPKAMTAISNVNGTEGSFTVTVSGVTAPSGVSKVQIPVWCADDQSDIKWYEGFKVREGVYIVNVNAANHGFHFGNYKVHVYVTMGNGITACAAATSRNFQPKNYVYSYRISNTQYEVGILGATEGKVQFPTWSDANGQDDMVWYQGNDCGGGKWNVRIDSLNHSSSGGYTTHVYVGNACVGTASYSLDRIPPAQAAMMNRANWYSSSTPYLILVNKSSHLVGVFQGWQGNWNLIKFWDCADGKSSTPTVEGEFRVGSRGYYFNSGAYRCYWWTQFYNDYLFHSVLYDWNGNLQDGRVGLGLSHGCVRLKIDNAKWIYDNIPSGTKVAVYH